MTIKTFPLMDIACLLDGVDTQRIQQRLCETRILKDNKSGVVTPTRDVVSKFKEGDDIEGQRGFWFVSFSPRLLLSIRGLKELFQQYLDLDLPMKENWNGRYMTFQELCDAYTKSSIKRSAQW
ncbi:hypothetical protein N9R79_12270 [Vibrio sp.]|nr:hypothetical protein [Vibrio sp.]